MRDKSKAGKLGKASKVRKMQARTAGTSSYGDAASGSGGRPDLRSEPRARGRSRAPLVVATLVALLTLPVSGCSGPGREGDAGSQAGSTAANTVVIKTNKGVIEVELFPDKAPVTVENFLAYADSGFYEGTIFHRVIPNFMIQGGGYDMAKQRKPPTRDPIENEAANGLKNETGTIAMARTSSPHSATCQFFINVKKNVFLDYTSTETPQTWGYTVFGRVTEGMDVVRVIEQTATRDEGGAFRDFPEEPIVIESVRRK